MKRCRRGAWLWLAVIALCSCGHDWDTLEEDIEAEQRALGNPTSEAGADPSPPSDKSPKDSRCAGGQDGNTCTTLATTCQCCGDDDCAIDTVCEPTKHECVPGCTAKHGCSARPNAPSTSCVGGKCVPTCAAQFGDCDGDPRNGCETALGSDTDNCGKCGSKCGAQHTTNTKCSSGQCVLHCVHGYSDCNNDPSDGCEIQGTCPGN